MQPRLATDHRILFETKAWPAETRTWAAQLSDAYACNETKHCWNRCFHLFPRASLASLSRSSQPPTRFQETRIEHPEVGYLDGLAGEPPGPDRLAAARALAERSGAVVLLKGPATVVAHPDGRVLVTTTGDARLATAGTGDVLAGVIAALCARGMEPFRAAAAGGFLHGLAADLGWRDGLVAGDVVALLPVAVERLARLDPRFPLASRLPEPT